MKLAVLKTVHFPFQGFQNRAIVEMSLYCIKPTKVTLSDIVAHLRVYQNGFDKGFGSGM